jgi:iron complex outermembrane receptor protein
MFTPPFKLNCITLALLFGNTLAVQAAQDLHNFNLPAQELAATLDQLAQSGQTQLLYADKTVQGLQAAPVKGSYTVAQAVQIALGKTDLAYQVVDNKVITVKPVKKETTNVTSDAEPTLLETVNVTDKAKRDTEDQAKLNYVTRHSASSTKTDTPIMQTPQSIQVIKRALLDDQQTVTLNESLRNVSGVVPTSPIFTPASDTSTRIRGFASEQLIDGFTQYYNPGDRQSMVNIERVEVLKGTNGILYSGGSGSPVGGLINTVSKLPQAVASRELGFKVGSYDFYQPYIDINQPLNKNILFRFTGEYTNAGSYFNNIKTQRYNLNPTLTFTNNETTTFTLQGKLSRWSQPEYQGLPATGTIKGNFTLPRNAFLGAADTPDSKSEFNGVWGTLDHKFNDIWSVNLKARYANSSFKEKVQSLGGADGFIADKPFMGNSWALYNAALAQKQDEQSFLGNATAKFDVGVTKNTFLMGADYSEFKDKGYMDVNMGAKFMGAGTVDLSKSLIFPVYGSAGAGIDNMFVNNTTYGGYVQLQSTIFDKLHLLTSVRLGHVGIAYKNDTNGLNSNGGKTRFLPRVGAVFDITKEYALFVNYSEGMRGQPFVNFVGAPQPEESTTIEGGLKFDIGQQLTGQIAGYQIERKNVAVTDTADLKRRSKAAGQQRSRGIETDLTWKVNDALSILANYAHTDARFTDNLAGVPANNRLPLVPEDSGRLWVNYRFQQPFLEGLSIGGGVYAQGKSYLSNNNTFRVAGYHTFDASIAYEHKNFRVATTVKNLTNEHYYQAYNYFGGRVIPSEGTTAYATFSVKF